MRSAVARHEVVLAVLLVGVLAVAGAIEPGFVQPATQIGLLSQIWETLILVVPMTLIVITAGIDLSVGSTMALCAVVVGLTFEAGQGVWAGAALALLVGGAAGALNGTFVSIVRVHPLIVTLATLALFRGLAEGLSRARPISGFPDEFTSLSAPAVLSLPIAAWIALAAAGAAALMLSAMPLGRMLYAIGHNERAARFAGLRVDRITLWLYTVSGLAAAVAAIAYVARRNTAKADIALGLELEVVTAVVLGGVSIFGGRGHVAGATLGLLLMHEAREFVGWRWQADELRGIVTGGLLIGAVLVQQVLRSRQERIRR